MAVDRPAAARELNDGERESGIFTAPDPPRELAGGFASTQAPPLRGDDRQRAAYRGDRGRVLRADYGRPADWSSDVTGRFGRVLSLAGMLTVGVVLAILLIPQFGPWLHANNIHRH
jgi:hypothetical protein